MIAERVFYLAVQYLNGNFPGVVQAAARKTASGLRSIGIHGPAILEPLEAIAAMTPDQVASDVNAALHELDEE